MSNLQKMCGHIFRRCFFAPGHVRIALCCQPQLLARITGRWNDPVKEACDGMHTPFVPSCRDAGGGGTLQRATSASPSVNRGARGWTCVKCTYW